MKALALALLLLPHGAAAQAVKPQDAPIPASQHPVEQKLERGKKRQIARDVSSAGVGALIGGLLGGPIGALVGALGGFLAMRGVHYVNTELHERS